MTVVDFCSNGGKARHPNRRAAERRRRELLAAGGSWTRSYFCRSCEGWHVTREAAPRTVRADVARVWAL